MNLAQLHEAIAAVCPIEGVDSDKVITFAAAATDEQKAAAQAVAEAFDLEASEVAGALQEVLAEFKERRELFLNRLAGLAGRSARRGDSDVASALDSLAEAIIPLDGAPAVKAATTPDDKRAAIRGAYKAAAASALQLVPVDKRARVLGDVEKVFQ